MFRKEGEKNLRKVLLEVSNSEPVHGLQSRYAMPR